MEIPVSQPLRIFDLAPNQYPIDNHPVRYPFEPIIHLVHDIRCSDMATENEKPGRLLPVAAKNTPVPSRIWMHRTQ